MAGMMPGGVAGGFACDWGVADPCCAAWDNASDAERERVSQLAVYMLWAATGRQYGKCEVTIRPCRRSCAQSAGLRGHWSGNTWTPILDDGRWFNIRCGCGGHKCSCTEVCEIELPGWLPEPTRVEVDGVEIDLLEFRIDDGRRLVWEDGDTCFPLCFAAGTLVLTDAGLKPIEDVREGDSVLTHKGRWRRVLASRQTGYRETVRVSGGGGTLTSTPDHPVYAREVYTERVLGRPVRKLGGAEWRKAADVVGYARATPTEFEPLPIPLPDGWQESDLPENFWWIVGRWIGDGWTYTSGRANVVFICCGWHERDDLAGAIAATGWDWHERAEPKPGEQVPLTKFYLSDPAWVRWLREHFGIGAHGKRLPAWILGAPEAVREQILDGYVSADGYYGHNTGNGSPYTSIHTVSRELALGVRLLAASLGHATAMYEGSSNGGTNRTYRVNWPEVRPGEPYCQAWLDGGHLWSRARKVEYAELAVPVYDLEVEEDHSFIADGFVVHNCQDLSKPLGEPGTWAVTYRHGLPVPPGGEHIAGELACELIKACDPAQQKQCRLPDNVRRVTREQVEYEFNTARDLPVGSFGIFEIDQWVRSVNPYGVIEPAMVYSPDVPQPRVQTWP